MLLSAQVINTKNPEVPDNDQIYVVPNATYVRYDDNVNQPPPPPPQPKKNKANQTPTAEKRTQNSDQRLAFGIERKKDR